MEHACFSGRACQRAFSRAACGGRVQRRPQRGRALRCLATQGSGGRGGDEGWTESQQWARDVEWNLFGSSSSEQPLAQPPQQPGGEPPGSPGGAPAAGAAGPAQQQPYGAPPPQPWASSSSYGAAAGPRGALESSSSGSAAAGPGEPDLFASWPANLADSYYSRPPLEFYPTSQLDVEWANRAFDVDREAAGVSKQHCKIFVILFGVGSTDTEGIYSLRAVGQEDGLPVDTIVAFENEDDAVRYSTLLEATMEHAPTVWPIEWGELLEFCNSSGYHCRLEPRGSLLIPPDYNVGMTDWEKSLRLRRGEFQVLESEPALAPERHALSDAALYLEDMFAREPHIPPLPLHVDSNVVDAALADPEQLASIKQSLERLLPRE